MWGITYLFFIYFFPKFDLPTVFEFSEEHFSNWTLIQFKLQS